jgi:hypothetical protein
MLMNGHSQQSMRRAQEERIRHRPRQILPPNRRPFALLTVP